MKGYQSFVFASDLHGDRQHKPTVSALLKFCDAFKPDLRVFGGDLWDFRPLRRGAGEDEKCDDMLRDFQAGMEFLHQFAPQYFLRGNHDERLWDLAHGKQGATRMLAEKCIGEVEQGLPRGCSMLPYDKRKGILQIGKLKMLHGYAAGVNAARRHAMTYTSCIFGHVHSIDHVTVEGDVKRMGRSVGALCELDMDYNRGHLATLRQAHGWAYGFIHKTTGDFVVYQAEEVGGRFTVGTDFIAL